MKKIIEKIKYTASKENGGLKSLSEKVGIKYNTLHSLISGKNTNPKIGTLKTISDYYNIKLSDIFSDEGVIHYKNINEIDLNDVDRVSIINEGYIDSIPDNSLLIFGKIKDHTMDKNIYLCKDNDGRIQIRKAIMEDGKITLISLNRIVKSDETPIYCLIRVEV